MVTRSRSVLTAHTLAAGDLYAAHRLRFSTSRLPDADTRADETVPMEDFSAVVGKDPHVMNNTRSREKDLASDRRAGTWARATARNRQRSFVRMTWTFLAGLAAAMLSMYGVVAFLTPDGFQRGFVVGAGVASTVAILHGIVLIFSGTASTIVGDLAEQWTAQELRPLTAHGWKLVNHFGLGRGDNDHVLVGPGGVVLLETKWNGNEWSAVEDDPRVLAASRQVRYGAHRLRLWDGLKKNGVSDVRTVVVLWGRHSKKSSLPAGGRRDAEGTVIIRGGDLEEWALRLGRDKLTSDQISGVWHEMERQLRGRDALEQTRNPLPRSMQELAALTINSVLVAGGAVVASSSALKYSGSLIVWAVVVALAIAAGLAGRTSPRWRVLANAWLLGSILTPLVSCLDAAWILLR